MIQFDTRSVYSFLESNLTLNGYIETAKQLGYQYLGLMDQDNLHGAFAFVEAVKKAGLQALVGMNLSFEIEGRWEELRLLALSLTGYQNLLKLATQRNLGTTQWEELVEYMEEIVLIRPYKLNQVELDLGLPYYLGVDVDSPLPNSSLPLLPLHTVRYMQDEDLEILQLMAAIKENQRLVETPVVHRGQKLLSAAELKGLYQERFPGAWERLEELVAESACNFPKPLV